MWTRSLNCGFLWLCLIAGCVGLSLSATEPLIIAHRGASGYLPEHTLEGVSLALGLGARFVEPDVVLTKDSVPVVVHDIYLEPTTNVAQIFPDRRRGDGHFYALDFTLTEIKTLFVGERFKDSLTGEVVFPHRFPGNIRMFKIPTLQEYVDLVQGVNHSRRGFSPPIGVAPEIKKSKFHEDQGYDITHIVHEVLRKAGYENLPELCILQSFESHVLKRLKHEFNSKIPRLQLIDTEPSESGQDNYEFMLSDEGLDQVASYAGMIGPHLTQLTTHPPLVQKAHQKGLKVIPYTVRLDQLPAQIASAKEFWDLLFSYLQVDGVFTDNPDFRAQAEFKPTNPKLVFQKQETSGF